MNNLEGKQATLKTPYNGYRNIILIEKVEHGWLVELCGSGKRIEVYEDEFTID
jgi:hypothetical protein